MAGRRNGDLAVRPFCGIGYKAAQNPPKIEVDVDPTACALGLPLSTSIVFHHVKLRSTASRRRP